MDIEVHANTRESFKHLVPMNPRVFYKRCKGEADAGGTNRFRGCRQFGSKQSSRCCVCSVPDDKKKSHARLNMTSNYGAAN